MSQELITQEHQPTFQRQALSANVNHGAIAIEQERAIAEAQGQMVLAKRFPRSEAAATAKLLEACKSPEFAAQAFYAVPNRGSGPSIRFAEEVARVYQNFQYGHRELSRGDGKSEIEVYAWDVENNNYSKRQITVLHVRDTSNGPKALRDQADIDNRIANVASKQMRGRILALVSKQLVADGIAACKRTIAGNNDEPISARVNRMTQAFAKYGVTAEMLSKYIGHTLDTATADELADMIGVYNAIKDGAKASEYFGAKEEQTEASAATANKLAESAKSGATRTTRKPAAAEPVAAEKPTADTSNSNEKPSKPVEEQDPPVSDVPPASVADLEAGQPAEGEEELF